MLLVAEAVLQLIPLILSLSVHECAHALGAKWLGDTTAQRAGRLTLNPAAHVDPVGTVALPMGLMLLGGLSGSAGLPIFGWAKPTPVNLGATTRRLKRRTAGMLVSAAGPASNVALALTCALVLRLVVDGTVQAGGATPGLARFAGQMMVLNVGLAVFNLLPLGALDGHAVLMGLLPQRLAVQLEALNARFGTWALLFVVFFGRELLVGPIRLVAGTLLRVVGAT